MKKQKAFVILSAFSLVFLSSILTYIYLKAPSTDNNGGSFVKGEVLIGFNEGVSKQEAYAMLATHDLKLIEPEALDIFSAQAKYKPTNNGENYPGTDGWYEEKETFMRKIEDEDRVNAKKLGLLTNHIVLNTRSKGIDGILITFNLRANDDLAKKFIESFPELELISIDHEPVRGRVKVPRNKEKEYIEILEKEGIVKYAETNGILKLY